MKLLFENFNNSDLIELFYDKENKKYILIINNKKIILDNKGKVLK